MILTWPWSWRGKALLILPWNDPGRKRGCSTSRNVRSRVTLPCVTVLARKIRLLYRYRRLIAHLFATQGFAEHETTEPDRSLEPGTILLVRVGKHVDQPTSRQFFNHVMQ